MIPDSNSESDLVSAYTLGFPGNEESEDFQVIESPKVAKIIVPDLNSGLPLGEDSINTKHLLSNYNRKLLESSFKLEFGVQKILQDLDLQKYWKTFESQEIDLEAFVLLTNEDLIEIGIGSSRDRRKILKEIKRIGKLI